MKNRDTEFRDILEKYGVTPPDAEVLDITYHWDSGRDDLYVKTEAGWLQWDACGLDSGWKPLKEGKPPRKDPKNDSNYFEKQQRTAFLHWLVGSLLSANMGEDGRPEVQVKRTGDSTLEVVVEGETYELTFRRKP